MCTLAPFQHDVLQHPVSLTSFHREFTERHGGRCLPETGVTAGIDETRVARVTLLRALLDVFGFRFSLNSNLQPMKILRPVEARV